MDRRLNTSTVLRPSDDDDDDDEGYRGMASDETMDDAPRASDEAREPLLKRVGASVEGTSLMNHRLMKNPKFRALLVESVRGTRRDATRRDGELARAETDLGRDDDDERTVDGVDDVFVHGETNRGTGGAGAEHAERLR